MIKAQSRRFYPLEKTDKTVLQSSVLSISSIALVINKFFYVLAHIYLNSTNPNDKTGRKIILKLIIRAGIIKSHAKPIVKS